MTKQKNILIHLLKDNIFTYIFLIFVLHQLNIESKTLLGIDVLESQKFDLLKNKRVALLANNASRSSNGKATFDILRDNNSFQLSYLLSPEHGYFTSIPAGKKVNNDTLEGIPIISLYGETNSPKYNIIKNIDVFVVDIQDIGVRSYTYISSIYKLIETAIEFNKQIIILDRPNPLGGLIVDGNTVSKDKKSFVGIAPISYIHGCTVGELAEMFVGENWIKSDKKNLLKVIKMKNWTRNMVWEDTYLDWYPTSPHVPTVNSIRGLATIGILGELGIFSIGIGTTSPFQYIGYYEFKNNDFVNYKDEVEFYGLSFSYTKYQPFYGFGSNKELNGYFLTFDNYNSEYYTNGIKIIYILKQIYPDVFSQDKIKPNSLKMFEKVIANKELCDALINGNDLETILQLSKSGFEDFKKIRAKYLLY